MFSLENSFIRILFAVIIQIVCLVTAIFGIVCAGEHGKWAGTWGTLGIVPFVFSLLKVQQKENPLNWQEMIYGIITQIKKIVQLFE